MKYIVSIILAGIIFIALLSVNAQVSETSEWTGKLANGQTITKEDLSRIIKEHEEWLSSGGRIGKLADLSEAKLNLADLSEAKLSEAYLKGADLSEADLSEAKLKRAKLSEAKLSEAYLNLADLSEAYLIKTDLKGAYLNGAYLNGAKLGLAKLSEADLSEADLNLADLSEADLSGAELYRANLSRTYLKGANLSRTYLKEANLKKANAVSADFSGSFFEPRDVEGLIFLGAKGFSTIKFNNFKPVADLRKVAKECGLRNEERALTAALYKYRLSAASFYERVIHCILFGWTTDYGANPLRSFCVLAFIIVIFSFYYMIILVRGGEDGIWKIWITERVRKDLGEKQPTRLTLRGWAVLWVGLHFSLLSAFSIGWRELNVGNWIARLQRREYIYRATGWTRVVSGFQSLISVYLLVLLALTYFGRPFE